MHIEKKPGLVLKELKGYGNMSNYIVCMHLEQVLRLLTMRSIPQNDEGLTSLPLSYDKALVRGRRKCQILITNKRH